MPNFWHSQLGRSVEVKNKKKEKNNPHLFSNSLVTVRTKQILILRVLATPYK